MSQNPSNPFPDGKLPLLPTMEIDYLTSKVLSQDQVDQSLQFLHADKPALVIEYAKAELEPELRAMDAFENLLDSIEGHLLREIAPKVGGFDSTSCLTQIMWEFRKRVRRMLQLPVTREEIEAARARGEKV